MLGPTTASKNYGSGRSNRPRAIPVEQLEFMQTNVFVGKSAERSLPEMIDIIHEWRPHVVVRESAEFAGCVAAECAGIPHATFLVATPRTNYLQVINAPLKHLCALAGLPLWNP